MKDRPRRLFESWPDPALAPKPPPLKADEQVYEDLWLCLDCVFYLENGELPEDPARAREVKAGVRHWSRVGHFANDRYGQPWYCQRCGHEVVECEGGGEAEYCHLEPERDEDHEAVYEPGESEGSGHMEFSRSYCDCCGTGLAGERERYMVFGKRWRRPT